MASSVPGTASTGREAALADLQISPQMLNAMGTLLSPVCKNCDVTTVQTSRTSSVRRPDFAQMVVPGHSPSASILRIVSAGLDS